jgi:hypothetical protein
MAYRRKSSLPISLGLYVAPKPRTITFSQGVSLLAQIIRLLKSIFR